MTQPLLLLALSSAQVETLPAPDADYFDASGRVVTLPGGTIERYSPLAIADRDDALIEGHYTTVKYVGPPTKAIISLARCNHGTVRNLSIVCTAPGVEYGVLLTNLPPPSPTGRVSRACLVENVRVMHGGYPTAVKKAFAVDSFAAGGVDANNDHHCFRRCYAQSYREAAYYTHGTQVHQIVFDQCHAVNGRNYLPASEWPDGWKTGDGAYFTARDCFAACNACDFRFGNREQSVRVEGFNSEHSRQFMVGSRTGGSLPCVVTQVRWDGEPVAGRPIIDLWGPGVWDFSNGWFAGIDGVMPTVAIGNYGVPGRYAHPGSVRFDSLTFRLHGGSDPTTPPLVCPPSVTWESRSWGTTYERIRADGSRDIRPLDFNRVP